ncbi:hypothetical protein BDQ12DRAFT_763578, partial [Crucibulum laeve]
MWLRGVGLSDRDRFANVEKGYRRKSAYSHNELYRHAQQPNAATTTSPPGLRALILCCYYTHPITKILTKPNYADDSSNTNTQSPSTDSAQHLPPPLKTPENRDVMAKSDENKEATQSMKLGINKGGEKKGRRERKKSEEGRAEWRRAAEEH